MTKLTANINKTTADSEAEDSTDLLVDSHSNKKFDRAESVFFSGSEISITYYHHHQLVKPNAADPFE